jgi:hypothetical protein
MSSESVTFKFERTIEKALNEFEQRLQQQQLFQVQNTLLKELQREVKAVDYFDLENIRNVSEQYLFFYNQLKESGRSYENIVAEKNLVDTYSAFEKFLADCYSAIYLSFPEFLNEKITLNSIDLFINNDMEICRQAVVVSEVKGFIQKSNIIDILNGFSKKFNIDKLKIPNDDLNLFYEIGLIRNLIIHNNGIVNRIYKEGVKKLIQNKEKYHLNENAIKYIILTKNTKLK